MATPKIKNKVKFDPVDFSWERQVYETEEDYAVFRYYRDVGPARVLQDAVNGSKRSLSACGMLSRKLHWVKRVRLFDVWEKKQVSAGLRGAVEHKDNIRLKVFKKLAGFAEAAAQGILEIAQNEKNSAAVRLAAWDKILKYVGYYCPESGEVSMDQMSPGRKAAMLDAISPEQRISLVAVNETMKIAGERYDTAKDLAASKTNLVPGIGREAANRARQGGRS